MRKERELAENVLSTRRREMLFLLKRYRWLFGWTASEVKELILCV
jgi:hypothetical protein